MVDVVNNKLASDSVNRRVRAVRAHGTWRNTPFERIAGAVSRRVGDLLGAPVAVLDEQGLVLASNTPDLVGRAHGERHGMSRGEHVRIPLDIGGKHGTLVISSSPGKTVSRRLAQGLVELVVNEEHTCNRMLNRHERKNAFIHDLLNGLIDDEQMILHEARLLGLDFGPPRAVLLIDAAEYILAGDESTPASDTQVQQRAQIIINQIVSFFHLPNDTICAYIGAGEVAVLKASNTRNLATWVDHAGEADNTNSSWANLVALRRAAEGLLNHIHRNLHISVSIGIGRYHPGICGLAGSYQDAQAAMSLGRQFHGHSCIHSLDRLGIAAFIGLSDERTKMELATYLLSPLVNETDLIKTLTAFFEENCCPSSTAQQLAIHRNTLSYRLDKITALTGLDPRRFDDLVQIRLALLLRSCVVSAS